MAGIDIFGSTGDGQPVHRVALSGGGLTASIIAYGAAVQDLRIDGHASPLVLGFDRFEDYLAQSPYFGATVGRYANRIRNGSFTIDGRRHQAARNFLGKHLLHGGEDGYFARLWEIAEAGQDFVRLTLRDPDGAMGFPGTVDVSCVYRLRAAGVLAIELTATTDQPTLCNLAHHSYFNLDDGGSGDVLGHRMAVPAATYLPVDDELIPTGEVRAVEETPFDFRTARPIRELFEGRQFSYDHNFCLAEARGPLRQVAWVQGESGTEMEVWSTEPGLQFYGGEHVARIVPGLGGRTYKAYAGFCLEPQVWPDSPNHPDFPQAVLRPGETYRQLTEYRFRAG